MSDLPRILLFLCMLSLALHSNAQKVTLNLQEALEFALENSHDAKQASLDYEDFRKRGLEVITYGLPQINGKLEYTYNFKILRSPITIGGQTEFLEFGLPHNAEASFDVFQPIIDGRYFIGLKARSAILRQGYNKLQLDQTNIREQTSIAYFNALVASESAKLLQRNLASLEKTLDETRALYREGFAEELDVDRLELSLSRLKTQIGNAMTATENAKAQLAMIIGLEEGQEIELSENVDALVENTPVLRVVRDSFDVESRIEYDLLDNQVLLRDFDVRQQRADYYPSVSAFMRYGALSFETQDEFSFFTNTPWFTQGSVGVTVNIPIFDGLRKMASIGRTRISLDKTRNDFDNFIRSARLEVQVAENNYNNAVRTFLDEKSNLGLADKIYRKSNLMYREGVASSLDLTEAESDLIQTQIDYVRSALTLLTRKVELDKALGKL